MSEILVVGVVLALVAAVCVAVFQATKQRYVLALKAQEDHADGLEIENRLLRTEVRRLSSRPPPPPSSSALPAPSILEPPRTSFVSHGSIVPPPPDYLFELPKKVLEFSTIPKPVVFPTEPPPLMARPPSILDDEAPPSTVRSHRVAEIAKSLRPPIR